MTIQAFGYNFNPSRQLVDERGVPIGDGRDLILALINRTGGATGIVEKVNDLVADPIVAAGATLATATALKTDWSWVRTVDAGTGVLLLPLKPGNAMSVYNAGTNALKVYPPMATVQIDALGPGVAYSLPTGKLRIFQCWTLSQFLSLGN